MKVLFVTLVGISLLAGCSPSTDYRRGKSDDNINNIRAENPNFGKMSESPIISEECKDCPTPGMPCTSGEPDTKLAFVEIDEQGAFWDRRQVKNIFDLVRASKPATATPRQKAQYVVVFVHGWRHDARWGDSNVCNFKQALGIFKRMNPDEDILGIFVGWRGQATDLPGIQYLTVWDRKVVSEEVGRGALVELLTGIENKLKGLTTKERRISPNKLMLVGHSFGASVVFNALGPVLMERTMKDLLERASRSTPDCPIEDEACADQQYLQGYGDLVVLVDVRHRATTITSSDPSQPFSFPYKLSANQPPRMVILSSEGDRATRTAFPMIRSLSIMAEKHRSDIQIVPYQQPPHPASQGTLDRQTIGNFEDLLTHDAMIRSGKSNAAGCRQIDPEWLERSVQKAEPDGKWSYDFPSSNIRIKSNAKFAPTFPVWIMPVSTDLIADHSEIVGDGALVCLFDQLLGGSNETIRQQRIKQSMPPIR
jgi:predicted esterase